MQDIRFDGHLNLIITEPGFVQVARKANHEFTYKNGKKWYSFIFVQHGELLYHFNTLKKDILLQKNDVLFIPKNLPYTATYQKDGTQIKILTFDIKADGLSGNFSAPIKISNPELVFAFTSVSQENMYSSLFLSSKIYELLHFLENAELGLRHKYEKLSPALQELKQQYFKNEKISYYAALCNMSESNFRKLFKEYTGKSPIEYRNLIRIAAAKNLLKTGELTVSEAAYLVGFNNMSFFYEIYNKD
ncbi:MAG: helix-turn-helix transcriptional regulator [Clostridia bacterium]|nr:helix-turn-helix transcriptional regulator [Clostridia bacterium]